MVKTTLKCDVKRWSSSGIRNLTHGRIAQRSAAKIRYKVEHNRQVMARSSVGHGTELALIEPISVFNSEKTQTNTC